LKKNYRFAVCLLSKEMSFALKKFVAACAIGAAASSQQSTVVMCQEERPFELVPPPMLPSQLTTLPRGEESLSPIDEFQSKTWGVKWDNNWDGRRNRNVAAGSSSSSTEATPAAASDAAQTSTMRQFLMVRHGQYCNESNKDASDKDKRLTAIGEQQAASTGRFLRDAMRSRVGDQIFITSKLDRVYVSELTRAKQTAAILLEAYCDGDSDAAANLLAPSDGLLNERFPCDPEPAYPKRAKVAHMRLVEEAFRKYIHRPDEATQEQQPATTELMVGHGNIIRYFTCRALQLPPEAWLRLSIPHCSVTSLVMRRNGTVKLVTYGSFSHLAPQLQTLMNVPHGDVGIQIAGTPPAATPVALGQTTAVVPPL
jgi:serine/threonine-protein phosphatase PGAM5